MGVLVCDGCGSLRWSIRAKPGDAGSMKCEICGSPLRHERRRPGRRFGRAGRERRDFRAPANAPVPPR